MKYNLTGGFNDFNAHRPHISCPIKSRKYLKETRVETCPASTSRCAQWCLENPEVFFVYKPLITLMTLCSRTGHFSIDHTDKDQKKVTTLRICVCARLTEMKEMWGSTFKLPFIREDNKGSQCHYPPRHSAVCACEHKHADIHTEAHFNNLFKCKKNNRMWMQSDSFTEHTVCAETLKAWMSQGPNQCFTC